MVDEWLRTHPNPDISQHAGKGELFYDFYKGVGWLVGNRPMRNWRAIAKGYSFIDYKKQREAAAAARSGGQIEQRASGIDEARAFLRSQRGQKGAQADG